MENKNPVECCMDCWNSCANAAIMWQCLPVPVFGKTKSETIVRVATVGLNPSRTEFLNVAGDWKTKEDRLPLVQDFGARDRAALEAADVESANKLRANYFTRTPNAWFESLTKLLKAAHLDWAYATGTAVHLDLVACATWQAWGDVSQNAKGELVRNCHKHLIRTLAELPDDTVLLFDGKTAYKEVAGEEAGILQRLGSFQDRDGEYVVVRFWSGSVIVGDRPHKFAAWNFPVNRLSNDALLRVASAAREAVGANAPSE